MGGISLEEMVEFSTTTVAGFVERGEPSPTMEWIMHPSYFLDLCREADRNRDGLGAFLKRRMDGVWEFMHHEIRRDVSESGWRLVRKT